MTRRSRLAIIAALFPVLAMTLRPAGYAPQAFPATCLFCGAHGAADALNNFALFLPLGLALAVAGLRRFRVLGVALVVSIVIEAVQMFVLTRHASFGDVFWNGLGGWTGAVAWHWWPRLRPRPTEPAWRATVATSVPVLAALVTAVLLVPLVPAGTWYVHWRPDLGTMARYSGHVLDVMVGSEPMRPWRERLTAVPRRVLLQRGPIIVTIVAGAPPTALAGLVTVIDEHRREVLTIGVQGTAVIERQFRLATSALLYSPAGRAPDVLAGVRQGDTLRLALSGSGAHRCTIVGPRQRCGVDVPFDRAWALLADIDQGPRLLVRVIDLLWLALLFAPVGLWCTRHQLALAAPVALLAAGVLIPLGVEGAFVTVRFWFVAPLAIAAGAVIRRSLLTRRFPQTASDSIARPAVVPAG